MKMRYLSLFLCLCCAALFTACGSRAASPSENSASVEESVSARLPASEEAAETAETSSASSDEIESMEYAYPSEDAKAQLWESPLGYSLMYHPERFTLDDTDGTDTFTYHTDEQLDGPVYLSVQSYDDMDAETLAEGIALQSGMDDVSVEDALFGADSIETKSVYIQKESDGLSQIQVFYAIPAQETTLLLEICSYVGVPVQIDGFLEEMLGTFTLTAN